MNRGLTDTELALLAHELRSSLTVVLALNDLLRGGLPEERRAAAMEGIDRAVSRANSLVESALEGHVAAPSHLAGSVDLADLASQIVEDHRAVTGREILLVARPDTIVSGDSNALGRALGNLIDNALKYSLTKQPVEVGVRTEGASAILEVADHGCGVTEEDLEAAFEPFERLGRDHDVPGTGLGLAVVRSVAEAHGGRASIAPRAGGGTVARIELPLPGGGAPS